MIPFLRARFLTMFVVLRCLLGNNLQSLGLQGITEPISGDAANDVKPSSKAPTSTLPSPNPNEGNRGVVAGASVDRSLDSIQQPTFAALPVKSAGLPQPGNSPNKVIDGRDSHRMYDKTVALIDEENFEETHKQKTSMHNPRLFYLGTALFVSGSLLTFASFGFAAQSLLASLEGVQFVSNVVFAKLIRKQPVTLPVLLGVSMIVLGVATVVLVGDHSSEVYSVRHLTRLYVENHAYQVFLVVAGGSAVVLRYTERAYSKRAAQGRPWPYSSTVIPVTYAAFSAIFGTQSVVQAKCLMMALSLTANGDNQVRVFTSERLDCLGLHPWKHSTLECQLPLTPIYSLVPCLGILLQKIYCLLASCHFLLSRMPALSSSSNSVQPRHRVCDAWLVGRLRLCVVESHGKSTEEIRPHVHHPAPSSRLHPLGDCQRRHLLPRI